MKTQCPACAAKGNDTRGDNLVVFPDGHKHCFACGYHVQEGTANYSSSKKKLNVADSAPCEAVPNHSFIHKAVLKRYGVRVKRTYSRSGAERVLEDVLYYNYFDELGTLVGTKVRDYKRPKDESTYWLEGSQAGLYGLNQLKGRKVLYLCEGEPDTLALAHISKCKFDVLGLPGAQHTQKLSKIKHIIDRYAKIVLMFDPDDAGEAAVESALELLPDYKVWRAALKLDVCDSIEKLGSKSVVTAISSASKCATSLLVSDADLSKEYLKHLMQQHYTGYDTGFTGLNRMLGGELKPSEVVLFVAHSGRGKSTVILDVAYNMAALSKAKVMWVSTEMLYVSMVHKALECDLGTVLRYEHDMLNVPYSELEDSLSFISKQFIFYNGEMDIYSIEEAVYEAIAVHDLDVLVIDVLNDIEGITDWKQSSDIMKVINRIANGDLRDKRKPIAVILVAHTVKKDGKYSKAISLSDISGGGQFIRRSTCIIAMNGELEKRRRYLSLLKMPRMGVAEQSTCDIIYDINERFYKEVAL